jgi:hypothetical protein
MRILSNFQDYYDYSCTFFSKETTYVRKIIAEQDYNVEKILADSVPNSIGYYKGKIGDHSINFGQVILCNKNYPFAVVRELVKNTDTSLNADATMSVLVGVFYEFESIDKYIVPRWNSDRFYANRAKIFFETVLSINFEQPIAIYNQGSVKLPTGCIPSNLEKIDWEVNYKTRKSLVYNASLKEYKFPMDGRLVLQEIETFLNRHKDENVNQITDDKVLLQAKGFDKNSFKKGKQ